MASSLLIVPAYEPRPVFTISCYESRANRLSYHSNSLDVQRLKLHGFSIEKWPLARAVPLVDTKTVKFTHSNELLLSFSNSFQYQLILYLMYHGRIVSFFSFSF